MMADFEFRELENNLRCEYGSATSIDALSSVNGENSFFNLLKKYPKETLIDQRSPGPPNMQEYLRGRRGAPSMSQTNPTGVGGSNNCGSITTNTSTITTNNVFSSVTNSASSNCLVSSTLAFEEAAQSPRLRNKFQKLWESKSDKTGRNKSKVTEENGGSSSIFRKLRSSKADGSSDQQSTTNSNTRLEDPEVRFEEKLRKKAFAHYDCQSITANLHYASRLCQVLTKRRNTTTGASAASCGKSSDQEIDSGDNRSNELVLSCPYFRNELGGEEERVICLNRTTSKHQPPNENTSAVLLHRPSMSCGLALLEDANDKRWRLKSCPYQKASNESCFVIEDFDIGATYYRQHFSGLEHQNWFGIDDNLGPIAISVRKERVVPSLTNSQENESSVHSQLKHQYRLIIRTSELSVLRGTVFEECIPALSSSKHHHNNHHAKEVLEYIAPEISLACLRLGTSTADEELLKLDEQLTTRTYKIGVLYCRNGQSTEEEMYNNEHSSPAFDEFLTCLGEKVRLNGFDRYRGGLDLKTDTTGLYSVYANYNDCEIMFHVSTLLPYTPNNRQQLLRKRHIGNDIVTIVFQEPDALPFTPKTIRSQFQHVFIIVRVLPGTRNGVPTRYAVAVSRSKEVPVFGPPIPKKGLFTKSKAFTEFLLSKVINAENAAHRSEKFRSMAQRTRHEYLKDLAQNHVANTTVNDVSCGSSAGAKLVSSIFGSSKKSKSNRGCRDSRFIGDAIIKGGIMWEMYVEDYGQNKPFDCLVAVSSDTFVIIEEATKEIMFATPNFSILGWISNTSTIKIFYHQGECILLRCKDQDLDEIAELITRLKCVTDGCEAQELTLRRNSLGQLGFHVGDGGIVTEVEKTAFVWQAGLRKNARIVEICKVAIATLEHEQMVDLLKTSVPVTITVLPAKADGSPRRGCPLHNCSYLTPISANTLVGDYENVGNMFDRNTLTEWKKTRSCTPQSHLGKPSMHTPLLGTGISAHMPGEMSRGPSTTPSPLYSNVSSPRMYNATPTSVYGTPKKDYKCATVSGSKNAPRGAHDHSPMQHIGNLVVSRSELSLANRKSPALCNVAVSSIPLQHSRSHSHHLAKQTRNFSIPSSTRQSGIADSPHKPPLDYHSDTSSSNEWCSNSWSLPATQRSSDNESSGYGGGTLSSVKDRVLQAKSPKLYSRPLRNNIVEKPRIKNGSNKSSGSSCSGSSTSTSTLQEDLLKLISPEYMSDPIENVKSSSNGGDSCKTQYSTPYSYLERNANKDGADKTCDVILTVAQPAQVVSSEPSSPADFQKEKDKFLMSQSFAGCSLNALQQVNIPLADEEGAIDWSSLVDTTNRAVGFNQLTDNFRKAPKDALDEWLKEFGSSLSSSNVEDKKELENRVRKLQSELMKEQTDKETLAQQVRRLQEENQRLHEESQTAAAQLRRFTEWFFQNMNAK